MIIFDKYCCFSTALLVTLASIHSLNKLKTNQWIVLSETAQVTAQVRWSHLISVWLRGKLLLLDLYSIPDVLHMRGKHVWPLSQGCINIKNKNLQLNHYPLWAANTQAAAPSHNRPLWEEVQWHNTYWHTQHVYMDSLDSFFNTFNAA